LQNRQGQTATSARGKRTKHVQVICRKRGLCCVSEGKENSDVSSKRGGTLTPLMPSLP